MYKSRKLRQGGGVGFFVKKSISFSEKSDFKHLFIDGIFESLTIEIQYGNNSILICNIYRPNNIHLGAGVYVTKRYLNETFLEHFSETLDLLTRSGKKSIFLGDTNINLFEIGVNEISVDYINLSNSEGFQNVISKATRISGNKPALIDHIGINFNCSDFSCGVIVSPISDHFPVFFNMNVQRAVSKEKPKHKYSRRFSRKNISAFKEGLLKQDWSNVYSTNDVNLAYDEFCSIFFQELNVNIPLKKAKTNSNDIPRSPFMTNGLLVSRKKKLDLFKRFKRKPSEKNKKAFIEYRNLYNKTLRAGKKKYWEELLESNKRSPQKVWNILKNAANIKNTKSEQISEMYVNDELISDELGIANAFNEYFTSIGPKKASEVGPSDYDISFESYLPDPCPSSMFMQPLVPSDIYNIIMSLKKKRSTDALGLSTTLIQNVVYEIMEPLTHICNLSFSSGIFPENMKISKTVPVYKKDGSNLLMNNFRPISLINVFSKILEKIMCDKLTNFLSQNDFFYENQFGFLRGRSVQQAVIKALNFISKAMNSEKLVVGVFLDVSKAFDVLNRDILIYKLENAGIRGVCSNWFKSYLSGRKQRVCINGNCWSENEMELHLGVLQGSLLGSLLFLIYVNDFHSSNTLFKVIFADDTTLLKADSNPKVLLRELNFELENVVKWYRANKLVLNVKKSNYMVF